MYEEWKDIEGFEGHYAVSNLGRVKSLHRKASRPRGEQTIHEKLLKPILSNYLNVSLWKNGRVKVVKIHRLVATAFLENPLHKPEVNHKDGNRLNNHADNLEWVTKSENVIHAVQIGLAPVGERHKNHKLTSAQVEKIRAAKDISQRQLAEEHNCSQSTISNIKNRKTRNYK